MDDVAGQFLDAIHRLEDVRDAITPDQASAQFDETTLQLFWKKWPDLSAWAGSLWRMLSEELAGPSSPHLDGELAEVGGRDGAGEAAAAGDAPRPDEHQGVADLPGYAGCRGGRGHDQGERGLCHRDAGPVPGGNPHRTGCAELRRLG